MEEVQSIDEIKSLESNYAKQPDKFVLTVKLTRFGIFAAKNSTVTIMQNEKQIERAATDRKGTVSFTLTPGDYSVVTVKKSVPITLREHSMLKL